MRQPTQQALQLSRYAHQIANGPVAHVLGVAPQLIGPTFDRRLLALGVYAWHKGSAPATCSQAPCPADPTGKHATQAMQPLLITGHIGAAATKPIVDGLAPSTIRHVEAHSVAIHGMSNWDAHATRRTVPGDPRSWSGTLFEIQLVNRRNFRFTVAASGLEPWANLLLARLIGDTLIADLIKTARIASPSPATKTFITGAHPEQVARLSGQRLPARLPVS